MKRSLAALVAALFVATASGQNPVPAGKGSYAEFPPPHEGDGPAEMIRRTVYVVSTNTRPIPTNDWWTDLLINKYCGDLWAYPLTVSADEQGLNICYPTRWNPEGTAMVLEHPLEIQGEVEVKPDPSNILLADFEGGAYGSGWKTTGTAFGSRPATGTFTGQVHVTGYLGKGLVNSFNGGDEPTGTLVSPVFIIKRRYIHFLIAGGEHPGATCMDLLVGKAVARTATGADSEELAWQTWDVSGLAGKMAQIRIVDQLPAGWAHICVDHIYQSDKPIDPARKLDTRFAPADARALDWGDWTLRFRMEQAPGQHLDVTLGHGLPFVWTEFQGIVPTLRTDAEAAFFGRDGSPLVLPLTNDHLGIECGGRAYAVFAPPRTGFEFDNDKVRVTFAGRDRYLAVSPLPARQDLPLLRRYAYAVPRDSRMDWTYDPKTAEVTTRWRLTTEALRGTNTDVVQGWIPHHYRATRHNLDFNGIEYATPRGRMRCASGNDFEIAFRFDGVLPALPCPEALGVTNDYQPSRMEHYLSEYAKLTNYGGDTYWGGKDLLQYAQYMTMAHAMQHPSFAALRDTLRTALTDWFTYTPGEEEHYFARYPNWGALVGFNESYWSYQFTDHHFHYGYFTTAAALLGMYDPGFLEDYGPMARAVAKEYADWERDDPDFPFLRTFDPWAGHSWAGGFSSAGGNNQESSSEAMQSWGGLFLLGEALGDGQMAAAGAMGYAMESAAAMEYWFDLHGDIFATNYGHTVAGILFGSGQAYATYFSGDPAWVHGIQWLPLSPLLGYLARDPEFARREFGRMRTERLEKEGKNDISSMGAGLGNVVLGFALHFDPGWVAGQMDELWDRKDPVAREIATGGLTYYLAHADRMLGPRQWNCHASIPTSAVYFDERTGTRSYVAFNPKPDQQEAIFYRDAKAVGRLVLPPRALVRETQLLVP